MSISTVPLPTAFFHPILRVLSQHPGGLRRRDLHEPVADVMGLTPAQRAEVLPSGAQLRYRHRLGWGLNMLKTAGYVEAPSQGTWRLTPKGKDLLSSLPEGFDDYATRGIVRESQAGTSGENPMGEEPVTGEAGQTPEEQVETGVAQVRSTIAKELLQRIAQASPAFFEELVLDLLHALGYGTSLEDPQHLGRSGDGGIDGVISLDKLGLEKVYVQAKRWQGPVGRPEVQAFYGALAGRRAKKGVLITTSSFTREARDFSEQVSDSIALIDGTRLTTLMINQGVGVTHYRIIRLPRIDSDYFADA
jgi:restriction system protein